jgi:CHAT domain-containing protein/tetratricopeptide (TPR) repeat protein
MSGARGGARAWLVGVVFALGAAHVGAAEPAGKPPAPTLGEVKKLEREGDLEGAAGKAEALVRQLEKERGAWDSAFHEAVFTLAELNLRLDRYARAEQLYEFSIDLVTKARGPSHPDLARGKLGLADLAAARGETDAAQRLYTQARDISRQKVATAAGESYDATHLREHTAALVGLGRLDEARGNARSAGENYERALALRLTAFEATDPLILEVYLDLARALFLSREPVKLETAVRRALGQYERMGKPSSADYGAILNLEAKRLHLMNQLPEARATYERAVAEFERQLGPKAPELASAIFDLSLLLQETGDIEAAVQTRARGEEIVAARVALVLASGTERQKLEFTRLIAPQTHRAITLHRDVAPGNVAAARLALLAILRRKGIVLDAVSRSDARDTAALSPTARAKKEELRRVEAQLSLLATSRTLSGDERQRLSRELGHRADRLERELAALSGAPRPPASFGLEDVAKRIPPGAALVEIAAYLPREKRLQQIEGARSARYIAYLLDSHGTVSFADLGDAKPIEYSVDAYRSAVRSQELKRMLEYARGLDELVMRPIRARLGEVKMLFVAPDGPLNLIPFDTLIDERGRYALEDYAFTYLSSGRDLLAQRTEVRAISARDVVLFADPDFDAALVSAPAPRPGPSATPSETKGRRGADLARARFERLPGTRREAERVAQQLGTKHLALGAAAHEAALKAAKNPPLLHLATHGFFLDAGSSTAGGLRGLTLSVSSGSYSASNPLLRTGLALAGANRPSAGEDGVLTGLEASALDLNGTELVVLSACETGLGQVASGEGVFGLRRAFTLAGAKSQVMSLWKVDDNATSELMVRYYRELGSGRGRTEALRNARLELLASRDYASPLAWGAFIPAGDARPMFAKDGRAGTLGASYAYLPPPAPNGRRAVPDVAIHGKPQQIQRLPRRRTATESEKPARGYPVDPRSAYTRVPGLATLAALPAGGGGSSSTDGTLALIGFKQGLALMSHGQRRPLPGSWKSLRTAADGRFAGYLDTNKTLHVLDRTGTRLWSQGNVDLFDGFTRGGEAIYRSNCRLYRRGAAQRASAVPFGPTLCQPFLNVDDEARFVLYGEKFGFYTDEPAFVFDARANKTRPLDGGKPVYRPKLSPNGRFVCHGRGEVRCENTSDGRVEIVAEGSVANSLVFDVTGRYLAISLQRRFDLILLVADLDKRRVREVDIVPFTNAQHVAFWPGRGLAVSGDTGATLYDLERNKVFALTPSGDVEALLPIGKTEQFLLARDDSVGRGFFLGTLAR